MPHLVEIDLYDLPLIPHNLHLESYIRTTVTHLRMATFWLPLLVKFNSISPSAVFGPASFTKGNENVINFKIWQILLGGEIKKKVERDRKKRGGLIVQKWDEYKRWYVSKY